MIAKVAALYAVPLSLMFFGLSYRVITLRKRVRAPFGDGGDAVLGRAIRAHGNFAEYAPFALLLIALAEINGAAPWMVHGLAFLLVAGRCAHAWGVSQPNEDFRFRVAGMMCTFAVMVAGALVAALA